MEPFSPQDPLSKLLGKASKVEPRANFTQNVLRAVRQQPRRLGFGERLQEWLSSLSRPALVGGCAVLAAGLLAFQTMRNTDRPVRMTEGGSLAYSEKFSGEEGDVASTLNDMDKLSSLLAQADARSMTDTEVAFLVY